VVQTPERATNQGDLAVRKDWEKVSGEKESGLRVKNIEPTKKKLRRERRARVKDQRLSEKPTFGKAKESTLEEKESFELRRNSSVFRHGGREVKTLTPLAGTEEKPEMMRSTKQGNKSVKSCGAAEG